MTIASQLKHLEKLTIDNSPVLLTAIGVVGTIGTAVLTHKAATKANLLLDEQGAEVRTNIGEPIPTRKEQFAVIWTCYIPPVVSGTLTIAAIVGANHIGSKRAAAMAAAYTLSEKAYSEYREKVIEKIGDNKERALRDELAQDRINRNPQSESNVVVVGTGDVMCCDLFSGRYFRGSVEALKRAENETNFEILHNSYATLTEFYEKIGLSRTDVSEEIGWNQDQLLVLELSAVLSEDGQPCVAFRFQTHPVRGYNRLHP